MMDIKDFFKENNRVAVAFSGGVDSAVLLTLASRYADEVKAYYVKTAFQPVFEVDDARMIAGKLDVPLTVITLDILADKAVAANPVNRCYYCKKKLFEAIQRQAEQDGIRVILEGTNASDDVQDRPGYIALQELGIRSPLREYAYTKKQIREVAQAYGLPVANKPSYACLATRIPAGTAITEALLRKTEQAENVLRDAGFLNFRIRYDNGNARLELCQSDFEKLLKNRSRIVTQLSPYYEHITLDLKERPDE